MKDGRCLLRNAFFFRSKLPNHGPLTLLFANPSVKTYRLHSGLGGDVTVHELMLESRLAYTFPQQLL